MNSPSRLFQERKKNPELVGCILKQGLRSGQKGRFLFLLIFYVLNYLSYKFLVIFI